MTYRNRTAPLRRRDIARRFDRAAGSFADADFLHRRTLDGIVERLEPMQLDPRRLLDLGSGTGAGSRRLAKTWRRARVTSVDLSAPMLAAARRQRSRFARIREVRADAAALPFADATFDMAVANLSLPWFADPEAGLREIARVLRKEGLFVFASLGPESLVEVREAWRAVDEGSHVHPFADMHDVGDALLRAGLRDPVLDVEHLAVSYAGPQALYRDLTALGARNALAGRSAALTGKRRFRRFEQQLVDRFQGGPLAISLELVFGHAWGGGSPHDPAEFRVDPQSIGRIRRR